MPRLIIAAAICAIAHSALSVHMQIGVSGFSDISGGWVSGTEEVGCATGGCYLAQSMIMIGNWYRPPGSSTSQDNFMRVGFESGGMLYISRRTQHLFEPVECHAIDRLDEWSHIVVTVRGNPYSPIFNDTGTDLVVNNVLIKSRKVEMVLFPFRLEVKSSQVYNLYDLDSGNVITPQYSPTYYGDYMLYRHTWSGGIRISDQSATQHVAAEPLVFGDMVSANEDKILYAENEMPVYADGVVVVTNIALNTWWDFSSSEWGGSPKAKINDEVVCDGHSASHIIDHNVSTDGMKVYDGMGYFDFTMSLGPTSGYSGGSCTMRCWDASQGSSTSAYASTPVGHKAESSAGTGVARFRVKIDIRNGTWEVYTL